jgi:hypothetical protein
MLYPGLGHVPLYLMPYSLFYGGFLAHSALNQVHSVTHARVSHHGHKFSGWHYARAAAGFGQFSKIHFPLFSDTFQSYY